MIARAGGPSGGVECYLFAASLVAISAGAQVIPATTLAPRCLNCGSNGCGSNGPSKDRHRGVRHRLDMRRTARDSGKHTPGVKRPAVKRQLGGLRTRRVLTRAFGDVKKGGPFRPNAAMLGPPSDRVVVGACSGCWHDCLPCLNWSPVHLSTTSDHQPLSNIPSST